MISYPIAESLSKSEQRVHKKRIVKQVQEKEMWERRFPGKRDSDISKLHKALFERR